MHATLAPTEQSKTAIELTPLRLTRAEAAAWINAARRGAFFFVFVEVEQTPGELDGQFRRRVSRHIPLSRKDALAFVRTYLRDRDEEMGRRIPCEVHPGEAGRDFYWIG